MASISVNGKTVDLQLDQNATIDQMLMSVFNGQKVSDDTIAELFLDGIAVDEEAVLKQSIAQYRDIAIKIKSKIDLAFESLQSSGQYIDVISDKIMSVTAKYNDNKFADANKEFADMIELMDLFIQLTSSVNSTLKREFESTFEKSEIIVSLEMRLITTLQQLIPAKEKSDIIMLCDLLEYELIDILGEWKSKVIPELLKLKDN